jgi:outer membrane receptor protein involved in Fe transport
MKRISGLLLLALITAPSILFSQPGSGNGMPDVNFQITGIVLDSISGKPVEYATVALVSMRDSSIAGGGITDSKGYFSFNSKVPGKFILKVNFMGYAIKNQGPVLMKPGAGPVFDQGTIRISPSATSLSGVEIVADRPMIELSIDKKVVNVAQNLTATGGTALDVLKDVPSVEVDQDGNVSMRGSENVTILIDGRPSTLTGADRRAALEQIDASSIESVELITNPSAKYSPDGMTGIINIILKKKKGTGLNSLLSLNAGTGNKYNGTFSLSYSTDKWTLFGSLDYSDRQRKGEGYSNRTTYSLSDSYFLRQDFDEKSRDISYSSKIGGEYYFSPKLILSGSASYRNSKDNGTEDAVSYTQNPTGEYTSIYKNINIEDEAGYNYDAMLNLKKRFSKPKNEITFDFSYSYGNNNDSSFTRLSFLEDDFSTISSETPLWTKTASPGINKIYTGKIDYVYPFNDSTKLEAGFDGSLRTIDADSRYFDYSFGDSQWNFNDTTSNHFLFDELINAIYLNYSTKIKKWGFSLGSRFEAASTNAREADSTDNIKTYNSWYPTGAVSYKLAKLQEIQITYSRRINRPSFRSLNPFVDYSAYPNIRTGNPYLNPEYINSFELSYAYYSKKGTFMPSVFYKKVNDVMSRYRQNILFI